MTSTTAKRGSATAPHSRRSRAIGMAAAVASIALLAGCSAASGSTSATTAAKASYPDVTLQLADIKTSTDAWTLWVNKLAAKVLKDTQGHLKIQVYPNSELGTNAAAQTAAQTGAIAMTLSAPQLEATLAPGINPEFTPGYFNTVNEAAKIIGSKQVRDLKNKALAPSKLQILSSCFAGFTYLQSIKPYPTLSSLAGASIRVPDQPNAAMITAMGAKPVVVPLSETYLSLQTGQVQAATATGTTALAQKYYQVAKNLDLNPLNGDFEDLLINTTKLSQLSPAEQKVLTDDAAAAEPSCTTDVAKANQQALDQLKAQGVTLVAAQKDYSPFTKAFSQLRKKNSSATPLATQLDKAERQAIGG